MIEHLGRVNPELAATLRVRIRGPLGEIDVDSVVDTGFDGFLTVPSSIIQRLGLGSPSLVRVELAGGMEASLRRFRARAGWGAELREVLVLEAEGGPLIGMAILKDCTLGIEVWPGGAVRVAPRLHG